nr:activator-dependent family glycosyltransferase [Saccharothrix australiensis]
MRVLFATCPNKSIFQYFAPMAWALRTAGHDVRVAAQPKFADVITQAGLTAVPVGRDTPTLELEDQAVREAGRAGLPPPYDVAEHPEKASWPYLSSAYRHNVEWWYRVENFPITADLVAFARWWRPDLVVREPTTFAGAIAAKASGAAHARMLWGQDVFGIARGEFLRLRASRPPGDRADPLAEWLGGYGEKYGFEFTEDMVTGQFTIDQFPASLQESADLRYVRTRHVPYGGPAVVPDWLRVPPSRPRVALTMGLSATEHYGGYVVGVGEILDALSDLDVEVVATVADDQRDGLVAPDNARVVPYVPWHALTATCAAVIHHAGGATLATTSLHGVPQLAIPFHFDQTIYARKLAAHGAGLMLDTGRATGQAVREHLLRLLDEPAFGRRAEDLRDEMLALPSPGELASRLAELC